MSTVAEGGRTHHGAEKVVQSRSGQVERVSPCFRELDSRPEAWQPIVSAARHGRVTLVYSSHDTEHNNAVALQQYLQAKSRPAKSTRVVAADEPRRSMR